VTSNNLEQYIRWKYDVTNLCSDVTHDHLDGLVGIVAKFSRPLL